MLPLGGTCLDTKLPSIRFGRLPDRSYRASTSIHRWLFSIDPDSLDHLA
jgi:hypothetical protein